MNKDTKKMKALLSGAGINYIETTRYVDDRDVPCFLIEYKDQKGKKEELKKIQDASSELHFYYWVSLARVTLRQMTEREVKQASRKTTSYRGFDIELPMEGEVTAEDFSIGGYAPDAYIVYDMRAEFPTLEKAQKAIDELAEQYDKECEEDPGLENEMSLHDWVRSCAEESCEEGYY